MSASTDAIPQAEVEPELDIDSQDTDRDVHDRNDSLEDSIDYSHSRQSSVGGTFCFRGGKEATSGFFLLHSYFNPAISIRESNNLILIFSEQPSIALKPPLGKSGSGPDLLESIEDSCDVELTVPETEPSTPAKTPSSQVRLRRRRAGSDVSPSQAIKRLISESSAFLSAHAQFVANSR